MNPEHIQFIYFDLDDGAQRGHQVEERVVGVENPAHLAGVVAQIGAVVHRGQHRDDIEGVALISLAHPHQRHADFIDPAQFVEGQ